jgi:hypothetical protein
MSQRIVELRDRLAADPDNPKVGVWAKKIEEYETSVESIVRYGKEVVSDKPVGAEIEVPLGVFRVEQGE